MVSSFVLDALKATRDYFRSSLEAIPEAPGKREKTSPPTEVALLHRLRPGPFQSRRAGEGDRFAGHPRHEVTSNDVGGGAHLLLDLALARSPEPASAKVRPRLPANSAGCQGESSVPTAKLLSARNQLFAGIVARRQGTRWFGVLYHFIPFLGRPADPSPTSDLNTSHRILASFQIFSGE